jgi:hypothetical protein
MNKTNKRLKEQIEKRGGQVHIDEKLPDAIAEVFLRQILSCPDCVSQSQNESRSKAIGEDGRWH